MNLPSQKHVYDPLGDCGKGKCPVCARNNALFRAKPKFKEEFMSDAVSPFVGRYGYPNVNVGILAPPEPKEDAWLYDKPSYWAAENYQIPKIVDFRSSLLNSRSNLNIKKRTKLLELSQDIAMASNPVDTEIKLKQKPQFRLTTDSHMAPTGPNAALDKASITENPKIHTKVYKTFDDSDLKAYDALNYLYKNNFDESFLTRIFSVGVLGIKPNRKLVPTRFSITAVDSTLGNQLIPQIKYHKQGNYTAFFGGYLGNYYLILMFPEIYSYELFETYAPNIPTNNSRYMTDYEPYEGRKSYVEQTAGGFYACRLPILEKLNQMKRQSSVLALRFITDEYTMPLGVFVCREATRKALTQTPIEFSNKELMLKYAKALIKKKFNYNIEILLNKSILLNNLKTQKKLTQFQNV